MSRKTARACAGFPDRSNCIADASCSVIEGTGRDVLLLMRRRGGGFWRMGRDSNPPEGMAEGEGFEPPVGCPTTVFKTAALNRSANPPTVTLAGFGSGRACRRLTPVGLAFAETRPATAAGTSRHIKRRPRHRPKNPTGGAFSRPVQSTALPPIHIFRHSPVPGQRRPIIHALSAAWNAVPLASD
jgi:hypothetical protein